MELLAYETINPHGEERADLRIANMTMYLVNAFSGKPAQLNKYLLDLDPQPEFQSLEVMHGKLAALGRKPDKAN